MLSPQHLKSKDKVQIVAPAGRFEKNDFNKNIDLLSSWDLEVIVSPLVFKTYHQFAGTDEERKEDLQNALDNTEIKAIFCYRGGYGTARYIEKLNFDIFLRQPKWVCGFSDITVLLSKINRLGVQSLHSPMVSQFNNPSYADSIEMLKNFLFGEPLKYQIPPNPYNRIGSNSGELIGGNLTLLHCLISTPEDLDWTGKILFIEEINEELYHLDRMLNHLKRCGKLSKLKGIIAGHFTNMKIGKIPFGKTSEEIILDAVKDYNYPVAFGFPVGHDSPNLPLVLGREISIHVLSESVEISY